MPSASILALFAATRLSRASSYGDSGPGDAGARADGFFGFGVGVGLAAAAASLAADAASTRCVFAATASRGDLRVDPGAASSFCASSASREGSPRTLGTGGETMPSSAASRAMLFGVLRGEGKGTWLNLFPRLGLVAAAGAWPETNTGASTFPLSICRTTSATTLDWLEYLFPSGEKKRLRRRPASRPPPISHRTRQSSESRIPVSSRTCCVRSMRAFSSTSSSSSASDSDRTEIGESASRTIGDPGGPPASRSSSSRNSSRIRISSAAAGAGGGSRLL